MSRARFEAGAEAYAGKQTEAQFQRTVVECAERLGWCVVPFERMAPSLPTGTVICDVTIPGNPLPKERPRMGYGRARTPTPTKVAQYEVGVMAKTGMLIDEPDEGHDLRVEVEFYRALGNRVDVDNLVKLVLDGCNGVVWYDDAQVTEISARLIRRDPEPRTHLRVSVVGDRSVGVCARCGDPIRVRVGQDEHRTARSPAKRYCSEHCYRHRSEPFDASERDNDADHGFPGLILVGHGETIYAELKTATGKVSDKQREWHELLRAHGARVYVFRPSDWPEIEEVLSHHAHAGTDGHGEAIQS